MATSKVEVANIALAGLRANIIDNFNDESAEAIAVRTMWDTIRQSELAKHPYNFAIKRAQLPRLSNKPIFGYAYQFQLPADCLRVIAVDGNTDYKIEGARLLTNDVSADVKYVYDNTDLSSWSPNFTDLVAARLRVELSYTLAADKNLMQLSKELYDRKAQEVRNIDAQQDTPDRFAQGTTRIIGVRY